jgi:hypothetical protein
MRGNPLAIVTLLLSAIFFIIGATMQRTAGVQSGIQRFFLGLTAIVFAIPGCLLVLFYTHLFDDAVWFYQFRAFPYTELTASGLGLAAGVVYSWFQPTSLGERIAIPAILLVLVSVPHLKPVLEPIDTSLLKFTCESGVCLQSSPSTCGPASAATILRQYGFDVAERELAVEALTSRGGTENWYLARAIRRRGLLADFVIQPRNHISPPPSSIAGVLLPSGEGHLIAVMSETATDIAIADPLIGKLVIPKAELERRYHFTGFFLIIHPPAK